MKVLISVAAVFWLAAFTPDDPPISLPYRPSQQDSMFELDSKCVIAKPEKVSRAFGEAYGGGQAALMNADAGKAVAAADTAVAEARSDGQRASALFLQAMALMLADEKAKSIEGLEALLATGCVRPRDEPKFRQTISSLREQLGVPD